MTKAVGTETHPLVGARGRAPGQARARGRARAPAAAAAAGRAAEEVRARVLDEHAEELREQLAEFAGKVEIRIRATYDEELLLREVVRENPEIASLRAAVNDRPEDATYYERIRLGELVASGVERR